MFVKIFFIFLWNCASPNIIVKKLIAMFNNSSNLYGSEWLALVFSNRNKNYGAYELRAQSSTILMRSFFIAAAAFVSLFVGPMIYAHFKPEPAVLYQTTVEIADPSTIHEMKKKEEPKKEEPVKAEPIKAKVKTVQMSSHIEVVQDNLVNTPPPTTVEAQEAVIASTTQDGVAGQGNALPSTDTKGGGGGTATEGVEDNSIHIAGIDVFPEFPGGMEAWSKFIQKNLRYPYTAQDANIQGKVYLSFVVEKDGSITDVSVTRGIGGGCDEEAMRVIKKSPKWRPGMQNSRAVRVRYSMPINYTLTQ